MTEKRFTMVITGSDGSFHYWDKVTDERITSTLELENKVSECKKMNNYNMLEKIQKGFIVYQIQKDHYYYLHNRTYH